MPITNQNKPISLISNSIKVNIGEVWNSDLLTWANETRTWDETRSKINNITKISSSIINQNKP